MAGIAGLSAIAILGGGGLRPSPITALVPTPALSDEARATPAAQLLTGALSQLQTSGARSGDGRPPALIQVPPSPISSGTLQALQQASQQVAVRDQSIAAQAAEAPARELERVLRSVTRESTITTPDTTTTTFVETPSRTVTRTITETVTVPGPESAGVQELRAILGRAAERAGAAEDRGDGRASDRRVSRLADQVERRGDRLLDALENIVDRGGRRAERRIERALDSLGESLVRTIDRLFDRGGERGVSAFEKVLEENGARVVQTLGKVLEATGDRVSQRLEDLLVKAGPEVISALQSTVDRVRPTVTQEVTREETEVIPGSVQAITTTIPGSTVTTTSTELVRPPPTATEARAEVRRQVEAYSTASNLVAPLQQLASPPPPVPNPAAIVRRPEVEPDRAAAGPLDIERRGPIVRRREDEEGEDRRIRREEPDDERARTRPQLTSERSEIGTAGLQPLAPPIVPGGQAAARPQPGAVVDLAA